MPWSEFLEWLAYLEEDEVRTQKIDYYMAQMAAEVRRSYTGAAVSLEDLMIKFEKPLTPHEKMMKSKRTWASLLGIEIPE